MTPVSKKEDASLLENYRPVSDLSVVSKIYGKIMQKQIYLPTYEDIEKSTVHK